MALVGDGCGAFLTSETFIHHKYTVIPSDQQELLGGPDAWDTKGIPNVPPKVLQHVKEAFARRRKSADDSAQTTLVERNSGKVNGPSLQDHGRSQPVHLADMRDKRGHEHSDDDNGEPIPWSSSPTYHKQTPVIHDELPMLRLSDLHLRSSAPRGPDSLPPPPSSSPQVVNPRVASSPRLPARKASPPRVSQTPPQKAARPLAVSKPKARSAQQEPPSSLTSEPDLEYQPPRAITDVVSSVNRVRRSAQPAPPATRVLQSRQPPAPTPPSAQELETVPCTWKEPSNPEKRQDAAEEPAKKRRRVMKLPRFESSPAIVPNNAAALSGGSRAPLDVGFDDSETSTPSSSSSVNTRPPSKPYLGPHLGHGPKALLKGELVSVIKPQTPITQPGEKGYDSSQLDQPAEHGSFSSSARLPPNGPASQAPFVAFTAAYPDYRGTVRDFVSAAISIQHLQKTRSLAEFLYDDYIRVWAHQYLNYMRECVREYRKPLPAIQWYNEHVPGPEYNKRIFTKGNIADITKHHSTEAELVRKISREHRGQSDNDASSVLAATSPPPPVTARSPSGSEYLPQDGSPAKSYIESLSAAPAIPSPVAAASGRGSWPRGEPVRKQPVQPIHTPKDSMHGMLRPDQIDKIEPLRSVPGYVMTLSQSAANASKRGHDETALRPPAHPEVKDEEDERFQAQIPLSKPNSDAKDKHGPFQDSGRRTNYEVDVAPEPSRIPSRRLDANSLHSSPPVMERKTRSDGPSLRLPNSQSPAYGNALPPATAAPGPSPWVSKAYKAQARKPSPSRPRSPSPSFGDVLTQPPATAASFISDFARPVESIPDTTIKPQDVPHFNRRTHIQPASSSASRPAASLADSAAKRLKGKKLSKADRFRMFVEKRQASSSAPRSTIED